MNKRRKSAGARKVERGLNARARKTCAPAPASFLRASCKNSLPSDSIVLATQVTIRFADIVPQVSSLQETTILSIPLRFGTKPFTPGPQGVKI